MSGDHGRVTTARAFARVCVWECGGGGGGECVFVCNKL